MELTTTYDEKTRIWSGLEEKPFYDFDCSIGRILFNSMRTQPRKVVQISHDDGRKVTNHEYLTWAISIAKHLHSHKLNHKDIVAIVGKWTTYVGAVVVGCLFNCTPFHPYNPQTDEDSLRKLFEETQPKMIFCDGGLYENVQKASRHFDTVIYTLFEHIDGVAKVEDLLTESSSLDMLYEPVPLVDGGCQTMALINSSGSTGPSKIVCKSNYSLLLIDRFFTGDDVFHASTGMHWLTGTLFFLAALTKSATFVISWRDYTAEHFIELAERHKTTHLISEPRQVALLHNSALATSENMASVKFFNVLGSWVKQSVLEDLRKILRNGFIMFGYGLSEAGMISGNIFIKKTPTVSCGRLVYNVRARIVNENGENLPPHKIGEIVVHNGHKWNGYYGNPTTSLQMQDEKGWFYTGDYGYFDADNYLHVVERKCDIFVFEGRQYYPTEIEKIIAELDGVDEACVVGVPAAKGKNPKAAVVFVSTIKGSKLQQDDIKRHVTSRLLEMYKPLNIGVYFLHEIPYKTNGKVYKEKLKKIACSQEI